jgi:hypothetical protein|tara:strand:+ start:1367 stop:3223 length:1857 start_codon:yes stop_codon:yes gene_type:complete
MSNSGKIWDTREAYQKQRANTWETPGNRGMRLGGQTTPAGSESNTVEFVDIISTGNTADFGDLTQARKKGAGAGGFTRILCLGGQTPTNVNTIDFVNPVATGNFADFGDLINAGQTTNVSHCNNIKTISADGSGDADGVVITHMASQGNSSSFQNRTNIDTQWAVGTGSNTRFLMAGNYPASNQIDSMEIATTGTKFDFGNLTRSGWGIGAVSDTTRSVFFGGYNPSATNVIEFVTTASAGNATDFGDLTSTDFIDAAGSSNSKKGITWGYQTNKIDIFNIATTGNATDFGDTLTSTFYQIMGADNGGGGLPQEGAFPQRPSVNYMPGSGRVFFSGGSPTINTIELVNVNTLGNSSDFGNLTVGRRGQAGYSSLTRGMNAGGLNPSAQNVIDSFEMASQGNAADFGDLTVARLSSGASNQTRGLHMAGGTPTRGNVIDYVTIASAGNATDFGDTTIDVSQGGATASPTRAVRGGGSQPSPYTNVMDYVEIASTGNATDFGDLTNSVNEIAAISSSVRGCWAGGQIAPSDANSNVIEYITIASTGNATDFGDLTVARGGIARGSSSSNIRGLYGEGASSNVIEFITIASAGNATDFGDTLASLSAAAAQGDSHGGLQSS